VHQFGFSLHNYIETHGQQNIKKSHLNTQIVITHESFWGLRKESLHKGALFDSTGMSAYTEILNMGL
jgi:hypothetical protein